MFLFGLFQAVDDKEHEHECLENSTAVRVNQRPKKSKYGDYWNFKEFRITGAYRSSIAVTVVWELRSWDEALNSTRYHAVYRVENKSINGVTSRKKSFGVRIFPEKEDIPRPSKLILDLVRIFTYGKVLACSYSSQNNKFTHCWNNHHTGGVSVIQIVIIIYKMGINGTKSLFWKTSASSFDTAISVIEQMVAVSNNSGDAQGSLAGQPWRGC